MVTDMNDLSLLSVVQMSVMIDMRPGTSCGFFRSRSHSSSKFLVMCLFIVSADGAKKKNKLNKLKIKKKY